MDEIQSLLSLKQTVHCVEMHTAGEPTRIIFQNYPQLTGTLLQQRDRAKAEHDHIRRFLMHEPRGHKDMYGAILRPTTELTLSGNADIGVLFLTNEGYSSMCGHATIALGRFLVDVQDLNVFPLRKNLTLRKDDEGHETVELCLHAPCGVLEVTVPVGTMSNGVTRSDPCRTVSYISVPSWATGLDITISLAPQYRWPGLGERDNVTVSFAYGGAFFCLVNGSELGFSHGFKHKPGPDSGSGSDSNPNSGPDWESLNIATQRLKSAIISDPKMQKYFTHPAHPELSLLYSVIIRDDSKDDKEKKDSISLQPYGEKTNSVGGEVGLCYFANQQIDRSPTGSGVAARAALAYARGERKVGETWLYGTALGGLDQGFFRGTVIQVCDGYDGGKGEGQSLTRQDHDKRRDSVARHCEDSSPSFPVVRVKVEGNASYTGFHTYVVEENGDDIGFDGFLFG